MSPVQISIRLIAMTGLTNLVFWLLWPGSIVRVAELGWGARRSAVLFRHNPADLTGGVSNDVDGSPCRDRC